MSKNYPKVSLIISTYNWPQALEPCVKSVFEQTILPNEIIIADDGSTEETRILIEKLRNQSPIPLVHCWHEDLGFRLALIRNNALKVAKYEYIIQIDGDIVCKKNFIHDHLALSKPNQMICGRRVNLSPYDTNKTLEFGKLSYTSETRQSNKLSLRYRNALLMNLIFSNLINKFVNKGVLGSNMSYWLSDAQKINGYNEKIIGWGKEDDEFMQRLIHQGVKKKTVRFGAVQFHIEHPRAEVNHENEKIFEQFFSSK